MARPIVHFEITGPDQRELTAFYCDLFGWTVDAEQSSDDYAVLHTVAGSIGGAVGAASSDAPNHVTLYVMVPDVHAHLERIVGSGGAVAVPRTEIPGTVTYGMFVDPAGNLVGLVEGE